MAHSRSTSQVAPSHGVQPTVLLNGHQLHVDRPPLRPLDLSTQPESRVDGLVLIHRAQIQDGPLYPSLRPSESSTFFREDC